MSDTERREPDKRLTAKQRGERGKLLQTITIRRYEGGIRVSHDDGATLEDLVLTVSPLSMVVLCNIYRLHGERGVDAFIQMMRGQWATLLMDLRGGDLHGTVINELVG